MLREQNEYTRLGLTDMTARLALTSGDYSALAISPLVEMGAYEALWLNKGASFKSIAELFAANPGSVPSDFVPLSRAMECASEVRAEMRTSGVASYGVRVYGAGEYPARLRDAKHPIQVLYYSGAWDLVESRSVAVVGTRKPSPEGEKRTRQLVEFLVQDGFTIVSGLAAGIDTVAHTTSIARGGRTIAVIGTPLCRVYPKDNANLQEQIAREHLVVSQVPVLRYLESGNPKANSHFFPARNVTMSALTLATVIVEAGETSGTLYQARAAIDQGRKLFILDNCFRAGLKWPARYEALGAVRVKTYEDIRKSLGENCTSDLPASTI